MIKNNADYLYIVMHRYQLRSRFASFHPLMKLFDKRIREYEAIHFK